jgi:hypothetical protein
MYIRGNPQIKGNDMNQLQLVLDALEEEAKNFMSEYEAYEPPSHLSKAITIIKQMMQAEPVAWRSQLASGSYTYCNTPEYFDNAEPIYTSPVAPQVGFNGLTESETDATMSVIGLSATKAAQPTAMPFVPWSKEAEMMESWTHEQQPVKPIAERVSDLVERLGGIEYLESRSLKPVQKPLTYEQIQQLYIKAYNGGDHGRDFETAFVKEIEAAHGITGSRE